MGISIDFFNYPQMTELDRKWSVKNGKVSGVALVKIREGEKSKEVTVTCEFDAATQDEKELERKVNLLLDQKIKEIRFTESKDYTDISSINLKKLPPAQRAAIQKIKKFHAEEGIKGKKTAENLQEVKNFKEWKKDKRIIQLEKEHEEHSLTGLLEGTLSRFKNLAKSGRFKTDTDLAVEYIHDREEKIDECQLKILQLIDQYENQHFDLQFPISIYIDFSLLGIDSKEDQNLILDSLQESFPSDRYQFSITKIEGAIDLFATVKGGE